jgi:hypothetical protein
MKVNVEIRRVIEFRDESIFKTKHVEWLSLDIRESMKIQRYNVNDAWVLENYGPNHIACN